MKEKGEIVLYQPEGEVRLEVRVENETVWLTQAQMAELFSKSVSVISRHISNVFAEKELEEKGNLHFLQIANSDKPVKIFSLDVIISVGYRVKSLRGTQFRRWANQVLKDFLLKGYAIRQRKIATDLQIADRLHEQRRLIFLCQGFPNANQWHSHDGHPIRRVRAHRRLSEVGKAFGRVH